MYVVMVYDVGVERVGRRYLTWVQNSVLEGELSPAGQLPIYFHPVGFSLDLGLAKGTAQRGGIGLG